MSVAISTPQVPGRVAYDGSCSPGIKPLPPTPDFVALGMVATSQPPEAKEPRPPPFDAVRCVPKAWARKAAAPEVAWQGSAGTVWRTRHNLVVGAKGRQPPPMYELPRDTFSSDSPNPP